MWLRATVAPPTLPDGPARRSTKLRAAHSAPRRSRLSAAIRPVGRADRSGIHSPASHLATRHGRIQDRTGQGVPRGDELRGAVPAVPERCGSRAVVRGAALEGRQARVLSLRPRRRADRRRAQVDAVPLPQTKECRKRFSVKTGTAIQSSNLGYQTWAIAMYLVLTSIKGVSSMRLRRDLKITQKSVWHLAHRIRMAFHMLGQQVRQGCAVVGLAAARTPPTALGHVPP